MTASALAALAHKEKAPDAYKPGLKDGAGTTTCLGGVGPNVNQRALRVGSSKSPTRGRFAPPKPQCLKFCIRTARRLPELLDMKV